MFKFNFDRVVMIKCSEEMGEVIGRSEYAADENRYLIRYMAADGRAVEQWWPESALSEP